MACGSCGKNRRQSKVDQGSTDGVTRGYANLTDRQIKARLESYKRKYCTECEKRYICEYVDYVNCKNKSK